jgi:hypothetical protein
MWVSGKETRGTRARIRAAFGGVEARGAGDPAKDCVM